VFEFNDGFFKLIGRVNVERRELTDLVDKASDVVIGQLMAILHQGDLTRINIAKHFIWESLDGNRRSKLRDKIDNNKYLPEKEKKHLLENFFNHQ
jgi:hypothetical protein